MRRRCLTVMLAGALAVTPACGRPSWDVAGGAPRHPSAAGIVAEITTGRVTLTDGDSFAIADQIASFSTYTQQSLPLSHRVGQYVHLGVDGDKVAWLATIGVASKTSPSRVVYTGELLGSDDGSAIFADGTVLRLDDGLDIGTTPRHVTALIDPQSDLVVELRSRPANGDKQ